MLLCRTLTSSIGKPTLNRHAQSKRNALEFGIRSLLTADAVDLQDQQSDIRKFRHQAQAARVSPRSHLIGTRQPACGTATPTWHSRRAASSPRCAGPEAAPSPVNPAWMRAVRTVGTLNRPNHGIAALQAPSANHGPCRLTIAGALTGKARASSTMGSRVPSLARSIAEQKASQSSPALQAPAKSRGGRRPRGDGPEVLFR